MYHTFFKCVLKYYIYIYKYCLHAKGFYQFFLAYLLTHIFATKKQVTSCKQASLCWRWPGQGQQPVTAGLELIFAQSVVHFFGTLKGSLHKAEWIAWWACRLASWKAQWNHDLGQTHVQTKKKGWKTKKNVPDFGKTSPIPRPKSSEAELCELLFFSNSYLNI